MTTIRFDLDGVDALADRIDSLSQRALVRLSAVDAANDVAVRFEATARKGMNAGLNLTDAYISSRMQLTRAVAGGNTARAEIVTRGDLTILGHYPLAQLRQAGTQTRKGLSRGKRPSGVVVEIRKGAAVDEPQWFTMRLRAGSTSGDKIGVFVRTGTGQLKHIYGPSPYSLFRFQINARQDDLGDDLQRTAATYAADAIQKALS